MKLTLYFLGLLASSLALADAHEQYSGIALNQGNALQMNLCSLKPGKSMANYNRMFNDYVSWSKENDVEVFAMRATPIYGGATADGPQFEFIDMLISPFGVSGNGWTKWLTSEDGQKLNQQWNDTANCRVAINTAFIQALDQETLSARDDRVMSISWCTRRDGVTWDQMAAQHDRMSSNYTTESPIKAWTIMFPGLGIRNPPGEFAHLVTFADASGLMARQNNLANNEGWRQQAGYQTSYASCTGANVYYAEVLNRPGS